jgi:hypothetical protein
MPLPMPPTNFEPYEEWVKIATDHLSDSVDTAIDELQRDRDFVPEDTKGSTLSPAGNTRRVCIDEAVRRFIARVNDAQEG